MATPAKSRISSLLRADDEPGVYRFRVFYLRINGRRSVVGGWQLHETMRRLKLLHMYASLARLARLDDNASLSFEATVHGAPLAVSVVVGTWQIRLGPDVPAGTAIAPAVRSPQSVQR